jgi:hypothetical protein
LIDFKPFAVHDFPFPQSGHEKAPKPETLLFGLSGEELFEFLTFINFGFILNKAGPVLLPDCRRLCETA